MIQVTAAILWKNDRVMIARRKPGIKYAGLWEFPGGKVEEGESPEDCLVREMAEEFRIAVSIEGFFAENVHAYPERDVRLMAYTVRWISGDLRLTDHDSLEWVVPTDLNRFDMLPADRPLVEKLTKRFKEDGKNGF